jgi:hypothetical protein
MNYAPGLLQPLPIPEDPLKDIAMDFIEGLPKFEQFSVILMVMDRYTKYTHFFLFKHPFTITKVAQLFMDNVVKLHGIPKSIVSDRDKIFTSSFWQYVFQEM